MTKTDLFACKYSAWLNTLCNADISYRHGVLVRNNLYNRELVIVRSYKILCVLNRGRTTLYVGILKRDVNVCFSNTENFFP